MDTKRVKKTYRRGAVGALMDEYERAASELRRVVEHMSEDDFLRILDQETADDNCRSVQTIMAHVVNAGYGYADNLRTSLGVPSTRPLKRLHSHQESVGALASMLTYTEQTLDGKWEMTDDEIERRVMPTPWGVTYNVEQMLEHAIVHILRHRRQVKRLLSVATRPGIQQ
jgi:uncharacterized damage-inducible protein DinB